MTLFRALIKWAPVLLLALAMVSPRTVLGQGTVKRALFVFGDSQVDAGNNNNMVTFIKSNFLPYGMTHHPMSGRFSNGYIIPDFLAAYLNIASPPPVMEFDGNNVTVGLNFASGGAGVLNNTNAGLCITLYDQLKMFMKLRASGVISDKTVANATFLINVGVNDVINAPTNATVLPAYVDKVAAGYSNFFQWLYTSGARFFVLSNVSPAGCLPRRRANSPGPMDGLGCKTAMNSVAVKVNTAVKTAIGNLGIVTAASGPKIVQFDQYGALTDLLKKRTQLGFTSTNACCGGGTYGGTLNCGIPFYTLCFDVSQRVWWDANHPTERVYQIAAAQIWNGSPFTTPSGGVKASF